MWYFTKLNPPLSLSKNGEDRLRLGNLQKLAFAITLNLHYLYAILIEQAMALSLNIANQSILHSSSVEYSYMLPVFRMCC